MEKRRRVRKRETKLLKNKEIVMDKFPNRAQYPWCSIISCGLGRIGDQVCSQRYQNGIKCHDSLGARFLRKQETSRPVSSFRCQ